MVLTSEFHMYACAHMLSLSFNLVQRGFSGGNLIQEREIFLNMLGAPDHQVAQM